MPIFNHIKLYIYKESDMSQEEIYLNKRFITFFKELGYVRGIIPRDESLRKRLKRIMKTRLLMEANTKEKKKVVFGKLLMHLSFSVSYFYL